MLELEGLKKRPLNARFVLPTQFTPCIEVSFVVGLSILLISCFQFGRLFVDLSLPIRGRGGGDRNRNVFNGGLNNVKTAWFP